MLSSKMNVYVVYGSTGTWDERIEYPIAAYLGESSAKEHVLRATKKAKDWEEVREYEEMLPPVGWNEYDHKMSPGVIGMSYTYEEVPIYGDMKSYLKYLKKAKKKAKKKK